MSIRFTGDKTAIRRTSGLPTAHNAFTIIVFAKLLTAAPSRTATIVYTQTTSGSSAETVQLGGAGGDKLRLGDDYGGTTSSDAGTMTAGGASGANWVALAFQGDAVGANGLNLYVSTPGGSAGTATQHTNTGGSEGFAALQFGDLPYGTTGWFDGLLAHLKVYDRLLSSTEITAEFGSAAPVSTSGLISYHDFLGSKAVADALVPNTGTGTFTAFTSNPSMSSDEPVFAAAPTLTGNDTLPTLLAGAPTVTTAALASGQVGTAYLQTLGASGATPYTWSITAGALPTGLALVPATGAITGTPTVAGSYTFTVQVANGTAPNATKAFTVTIVEAPVVEPPGPPITPPSDDGWVRLPRDVEVWVRVPRTTP